MNDRTRSGFGRLRALFESMGLGVAQIGLPPPGVIRHLVDQTPSGEDEMLEGVVEAFAQLSEEEGAGTEAAQEEETPRTPRPGVSRLARAAAMHENVGAFRAAIEDLGTAATSARQGVASLTAITGQTAPTPPAENQGPGLRFTVTFEDINRLVSEGMEHPGDGRYNENIELYGKVYSGGHARLMLMIARRYGEGLLQSIATLPDLRVQSWRNEMNMSFEVLLRSSRPEFEAIRRQAEGIEFGRRTRRRSNPETGAMELYEEIVCTRGELFPQSPTGQQNALHRAGNHGSASRSSRTGRVAQAPWTPPQTYTYRFELPVARNSLDLPGEVDLPHPGPRTRFEHMPIPNPSARWAAAYLWHYHREFVEAMQGEIQSVTVALNPDEIVVESRRELPQQPTVTSYKRPDARQYARRLKLSHKERKAPDVTHNEHQSDQDPVRPRASRRRQRDE